MRDRAQVTAAAAEFPEHFGLRAFPGKRFTISTAASYVSEREGVILYTAIQEEGGAWACFVKVTPAELRREIVEDPGVSWRRAG
jgi:hypothetical protein